MVEVQDVVRVVGVLQRDEPGQYRYDRDPIGAIQGLAPERVVYAAAATRGLGVYGLRPYRMSPGRDALLFGYGNLSETAIRDGIALLAEAVAAVRGMRPP